MLKSEASYLVYHNLAVVECSPTSGSAKISADAFVSRVFSAQWKSFKQKPNETADYTFGIFTAAFQQGRYLQDSNDLVEDFPHMISISLQTQ
jgi:hypothetical protein